MFTIETNSNAGIILAGIMADPETYKVSFDYRPKGCRCRGMDETPGCDHKEATSDYVAIKQNERMWTRTLPCFMLSDH